MTTMTKMYQGSALEGQILAGKPADKRWFLFKQHPIGGYYEKPAVSILVDAQTELDARTKLYKRFGITPPLSLPTVPGETRWEAPIPITQALVTGMMVHAKLMTASPDGDLPAVMLLED